jgi:hypothetical protein
LGFAHVLRMLCTLLQIGVYQIVTTNCGMETKTINVQECPVVMTSLGMETMMITYGVLSHKNQGSRIQFVNKQQEEERIAAGNSEA